MSQKQLRVIVDELTSNVGRLSSLLAHIEMEPMDHSEWLNTAQVAALLNLSESRVYQLRYSGRLTPVKRGRQYFFNREQVKKLINEQSEQ